EKKKKRTISAPGAEAEEAAAPEPAEALVSEFVPQRAAGAISTDEMDARRRALEAARERSEMEERERARLEALKPLPAPPEAAPPAPRAADPPPRPGGGGPPRGARPAPRGAHGRAGASGGGKARGAPRRQAGGQAGRHHPPPGDREASRPQPRGRAGYRGRVA